MRSMLDRCKIMYVYIFKNYMKELKLKENEKKEPTMAISNELIKISNLI